MQIFGVWAGIFWQYVLMIIITAVKLAKWWWLFLTSPLHFVGLLLMCKITANMHNSRELVLASLNYIILIFRLLNTSSHFGCGWTVCTVLVCVTCCCWTVSCSLGSSAHSTPAAIEQQEIIVLTLDVFIDISPSASLQTLQHVTLLVSCNCIMCSLIPLQRTLKIPVYQRYCMA